MEIVLILKAASSLLAIVALGGLVMAGMRLADKPRPPSWLAMLHGFLAASALTLLIYAYLAVGLPGLAASALLILLLTSAGGVILNLNYHAKMLPLPIGLMLGHAGVAVIGFLLLILATLNAANGWAGS